MARRSLRSQLNQIRAWVRQGRTDAWIAHQLDVSVKDIHSFKREHDLAPADGGNGDGSFNEEPDLRAEDDALVAAALEEEGQDEDDEEDEAESGDDGGDTAKRASGRRRGRRGGRRRRSGGGGRGRGQQLEGTFDHGEEGYGLWLDPAVADDPVYAEHWAGHRPVTVVFEAERIVIRRAGEDEDEDDDSGEERESAGAGLDPDEFES